MNVVYICYWSVNDPLTISSVMPTLPVLYNRLNPDRVTLITVERHGTRYPPFRIPYEFVDHVPITPRFQGLGPLSKVYEMTSVPRQVAKVCASVGAELLYARCSHAGTIAAKIHRRTKVPFVVESFEPHSDYMAGTGTWSRRGLKYRYAKKYERLQMRDAQHLITVTNGYRDHLRDIEGVPEERLSVIPCTTDLVKGRFDAAARREIRDRLDLGSAVTGVYAGKFGDLYYDDEAFRILADGFQFFDDFRVLLLTPDDPDQLYSRLLRQGIDQSRVFVGLVTTDEVPAYLSAADFAYSFVRPTPAGPFQCPIKHGEYWAAGLPFMTPARISDDHEVIRDSGGGALLAHDLSNLRECHEEIGGIISQEGYRARVQQLAQKFKGRDLIDEALESVFRGPTR